jgi:thioredoxin reductase (NADPH)
VYAASEGLDTLVVEGFAPGGQAGTSSRIENYLGFPTGISGIALAGRAHVQAQKFGARLAIAREVQSLHCESSPYCLELEGGERVQARAVVIATGARYRRLDIADYDAFEGRGIHYAATAVEGAICAGREVVVVGGGNSAGQAAMFLSRVASHVHVLIRGEGLAATMSDYLVQRIGSSGSITLHTHTSVVGLDGDGRLEGGRWHNSETKNEGRVVTGSMFVMVGAEPNTGWLNGCVELDANGFVETEIARGDRAGAAFATSLPGVFAVGDVRARSIKRVASAVGEGSAVVASIHRFLAAE